MAESIVALKQAGAGAAPALTLMGITIQEIKIYTAAPAIAMSKRETLFIDPQ